MPFATTRMDLEIIIISKPNEDKYDITYMWNPKKKTDTNELMHKTETNPQTQKTNTITIGEREERDKLGV